MKLLPTITTIKEGFWRDKVREIDVLGINEAAVFPTRLNPAERQELYSLLEKTGLKKVPFVHLREDDMDDKELDYLIKRWGTEVFNAHPIQSVLSDDFFPGLRDKIYIENAASLLTPKFVEKFAGLCIDFSHLENDKYFRPDHYEAVMELAKKFKIGCAHISAIYSEVMVKSLDGSTYSREHFDEHYADSSDRFNYLANYPKEMFPPIIAIELENSLAEQLVFKKHIEELLKI